MRARSPDDAFTILLDPVGDGARLRLAASKTPLEEGVARGDRLLPRVRHRADVHAPEGAEPEKQPATSPSAGETTRRPGRRRRGLRRQQPRAGAARPRRRARRRRRQLALRRARERARTIRGSSSSRARSPTTPCSPELEDEFDYVFHLATYHGNQSSIDEPARGPREQPDHDAEALRAAEGLAAAAEGGLLPPRAARCAEHTYGRRGGRRRGRAGAARPRQPVPDLQGRRRVLLRLLPPASRAARPSGRGSRTSTGRGEILGAGQWRGTPATVWRNVVADVRLPRAQGPAARARQRRPGDPRLHLRRRHRRRAAPLCRAGARPADVYNLASGVETSIRELAETIIELRGSDSELELGPERDWDRSGHRFGSTEKSERELSFVATTGLDEGLRRTIDWTTENMDLIDGAVARHADRIGLALTAS